MVVRIRYDDDIRSKFMRAKLPTSLMDFLESRKMEICNALAGNPFSFSEYPWIDVRIRSHSHELIVTCRLGGTTARPRKQDVIQMFGSRISSLLLRGSLGANYSC